MPDTLRPEIQIALDCADPHRLVEFWAYALGYEVERHEDMIRGLLESGVATDDDVATVDGRLVWKTAATCSDPGGTRPRWYFQLVPEAKTVKNRMHVDIRIGEEGREAYVAELLKLGAKRLYDGQQGPQTWITVADPEGNEFCVS
jgi:Glyoxalase-like domain